nr:hypothetical protein Iba_chr02fCG9340 [Ipomoea batatas]
MQNSIEDTSQKPHQQMSVQHLEEEIFSLLQVYLTIEILSLQELGEFQSLQPACEQNLLYCSVASPATLLQIAELLDFYFPSAFL